MRSVILGLLLAALATPASAEGCRYISVLGNTITISDDGHLRVDRFDTRVHKCVTAPLDETTSIVACQGRVAEYRYTPAGDMELWGDTWYRYCD